MAEKIILTNHFKNPGKEKRESEFNRMAAMIITAGEKNTTIPVK